MYNPVTIQVDLSDFALIMNRALEAGQDLEAEIQASYPGDDPTSTRRRKRDSETARWLQSAIPAFRLKYGVRDDGSVLISNHKMRAKTMAEMIAKIKITDLPAFDLFRAAAPDWLDQVTKPGYHATLAEKKMFGAIMAIAESNTTEEQDHG